MALATYNDLKASLATFLGRSDLTTPIPDFITLCHKRLMRDLRGHLRLQVRNTTFSIAVGSEYVAVPSDFLELVSIYLNSNPRRALQFVTVDQGVSFYPDSTTGQAGPPRFITLVGSTGGTEYFKISPVPDSTYTATIEYYGSLAEPTGTNTNWILTDHPGLYLYGSLVEGASYLHDLVKAQAYEGKYQDELERVKAAGRRARWGSPNMQVRPG